MNKKILLAKGGLDGHDRGIHVVARALRDAGFEIVYGGLYCQPEEIARMAIEEDVDIIGISILSGAHIGVFYEVAKILKEKTNDDWFLCGGGIIPEKDIPLLHKMGVKKIFLPGTDTRDIINFALEAELMKKRKETVKSLLERTKKGEIYAASRLMTLATRGAYREKQRILKSPDLSRETFLIGVTGSGGVGKSTLINKLIHAFRKEGKTVGVVACDPADVSGGAVLGDRIRMQEHLLDDGVFVRSLAQHENFKAVTPEVPCIIKIFGIMKKDVVIIESVGAGQADMGFKDLVKTLVFVSVPGLGDEIQLLKGGAIKTADIIVVNQVDRPGADITFMQLLQEFGSAKKIYKTDSITGEGIAELVLGIKEHHGKGG